MHQRLVVGENMEYPAFEEVVEMFDGKINSQNFFVLYWVSAGFKSEAYPGRCLEC